MKGIQGAPTDASPTFLSKLDSTVELLEALRKADKARSTILVGEEPSQHEVIQLYTSAQSPTQRPWRGPEVLDAQFSHCGHFLAISLSSMQASNRAKRTRHDLEQEAAPGSNMQKVYEVAVYNTNDSQQPISLCYGSCSPSFVWAPHAPRISIAATRDTAAGPPLLEAVHVRHAQSGHVIYEVSAPILRNAVPGAASAPPTVLQRYRQEVLTVEWSPSGRYLLVTWRSSDGIMTVIDAHEDRVVGCTSFVGDSAFTTPALWHPSSQGLAIGGPISLRHPAAFLGMAVGTLPGHCHLPSDMSCLGFAASGQYFLTITDSDYDAADQTEFCFLGCTLLGASMTFTIVSSFRLGSMSTCQLMPDGQRAMVGFCPELPEEDEGDNGPARVKALTYPDSMFSVSMELGLYGNLCFSPRTFVADSLEGPRIFDLATGEQCWEIESFHLRGEAQKRVFDLCKVCQAVSWLKSGVGLAYFSSKAGKGMEYVATLHILSFA